MQIWPLLDNGLQRAREIHAETLIYDDKATLLAALLDARDDIDAQFQLPTDTRNYWTIRNSLTELLAVAAVYAEDGNHGKDPTLNPTTPIALATAGQHATDQDDPLHPYAHWEDFKTDLDIIRNALDTAIDPNPNLRDPETILELLADIATKAALFTARARLTIHDHDPHATANFAVIQWKTDHWVPIHNYCDYGYAPDFPDKDGDFPDETLCYPCAIPQASRAAKIGAAVLPPPTIKPQVTLPGDSHPGWKWIATADFLRDLAIFADQLPHTYSAIIAIPRSGMLVAAYIATRRNLPLMIMTETGPVLAPSSNRRIKNQKPHGQFLLVDDDLWSGNTMEAWAEHFDPTPHTATVYTFARTAKPPTHTYRTFAGPWLDEWKAFNYSPWLNAEFTTDFDGILCHDCPISDDNDGPRYTAFIHNARPAFTFAPHTIPRIITSRLEKYREPTMAWLAVTNQRTDQLIMGPWKSITQRTLPEVIEFKAAHVNETPHRFFIESQPLEAEAISQHTPKMIICPAARKIFNGENHFEP